MQYKWTHSVWNIPVRIVLALEKWIFIWIKWTEEQINSEKYIYFKGENSFPVCPFFIPSDRKRLAYKVRSCMFPIFKILVSAKNLAAGSSPSVLHILLSTKLQWIIIIIIIIITSKSYVFYFKENLNISCLLFVLCMMVSVIRNNMFVRGR